MIHFYGTCCVQCSSKKETINLLNTNFVKQIIEWAFNWMVQCSVGYAPSVILIYGPQMCISKIFEMHYLYEWMEKKSSSRIFFT